MRTTNLVVVLLLLSGAPAQASWITCPNGSKAHWPSDSMTMRLSATSFPTGSAWTAALQDALHESNWTGSDITYHHVLGDSNVGLDNGQSETWFVAALEAPATAWSWALVADCSLVEADVLFDAQTAFSTSQSKSVLFPYGGVGASFRNAALHELGHVQGAGHTVNSYCIMGDLWTHLSCADKEVRSYPGEHLVSQSIGVYGKSAKVVADLGVVHWRWTGSDGEYSTHGRCRVADSALAPLPVHFQDGEPFHEVYPGQVVRSEFTFENRGETSQSLNVGYYYSSDEHVFTSDQLLATATYSLAVDVPSTKWSPALTIPLNATPGLHALGAVIDFDFQVAETMEKNNATYTHVRVLTPDLQALSISGPAKVKLQPGASTATVTFKVAGIHWGGPHVWEIRLSKDGKIGAGDVLVGSGSSSTANTQSITVDLAGMKKGTYYWGLRVLPLQHEGKLTNNVVTGNKVKIKKTKKK